MCIEYFLLSITQTITSLSAAAATTPETPPCIVYVSTHTHTHTHPPGPAACPDTTHKLLLTNLNKLK